MADAPRLRAFVALSLGEGVREALAAWAASVAVAGSGLRAVPAANLHVTLCFLGGVEAEAVAGIGAAVSSGVGVGCVLSGLSLGEAALLPARRPRVLAVGIDDPSGSVLALQGRVSASLAEGGFYEPEARPFLAHVTVARVRGRERVRVGELPALPSVAVEAPDMTLYRSRLGGGGARYEPLLRVPLG